MAHDKRGRFEVRERPETDEPPTNEHDVFDSAEIERRAYELYERRGGEHGRDLADWLQAEDEIRRRESDE